MHDLASESLGAVLKTALDAVIVMRLDGTIAGWNDVAERTFGWSYDEANGKRMSETIIPPRFREAHEQGLAHFLKTGIGPALDKHFEIEAVHRDGHEFPIELSITRTSQFGEAVFLGFLRDISERRDAAERQALMIGELNHRAKNLLAVVAGIAHQTVRSSSSLGDFGPAFSGRLTSLGKAHEILTAAMWESASLHRLADELLGSYSVGDAPKITWTGPPILLPPRQLLSISMIWHELMINAVKYGAIASSNGHVALTWKMSGTQVRIEWKETGVPGVASPTRTGFGSRMIAMSVMHELRGQATTDWTAQGLQFALSFEVEQPS